MAFKTVDTYEKRVIRERIPGSRNKFATIITMIARTKPSELNAGLILEILGIDLPIKLLPGQEGRSFYKVVFSDRREVIVDDLGKADLIA